MRKAVLSILIALMLLQPVVGILNSPMPIISAENKMTNPVLAEEPGTRLSPVDHTNHVPILIDEPSDWVNQGWPGSGTYASPYIIQGWNITYDAGQPSISISNVDSYFVIRDCYIDQQSADDAIYLFNLSHATLEYLTIYSADMGIYIENANDTMISNCLIESYERPVWITSSIDCTISGTRLWTEDNRGLTVEGSDGFSIASTNITSVDPSWYNVRLETSDSGSITDCRIIGGLYGVSVSACENLDITDSLISPEAEVGLSVSASPYLSVTGCTIKGEEEGAINLSSSPLSSIDLCDITSTSYHGIHMIGCNNTAISSNTIHDVSTYGITVENSNYSQVLDNDLTTIGTSSIVMETAFDSQIHNNMMSDAEYGIEVTGCPNINLMGNQIYNIVNDGIVVTSCESSNIIDNEIDNVLGNGIDISASHNGIAQGNMITETDYGVYLSSVDNWTVSENSLEDIVSYGIYVVDGQNHTIDDNELSSNDKGIYSSMSDQITVSNNQIDDCIGEAVSMSFTDNIMIEHNSIHFADALISIFFAENVTIQDNTLSDGITHTTMMLGINNLEMLSNTIEGSSKYALYFDLINTATFSNNVITDTGFNFAGSRPVSNYNHSFSGNTINGKQFYYLINNHGGGSIDGSLYGQIFLVNSTGWTINGGTFEKVGVPFMVYHCDSTIISGAQSIANVYGIKLWSCNDAEIINLDAEGNPHEYVVYMDSVFDFDVNNFNAIDLSESYVILASNSANGTISDGYVYNCKEGIIASQSSDIKISDCQIIDSVIDGIRSVDSSNITVQYVEVVNSTKGIFFSNSDNGTIRLNEVRYCSQIGIHISATSDGNATFNLIESNKIGLHLTSSNNWRILNNTIRWNDQYGVRLDGISAIDIYYNELYLNFDAEAYDGNARFWDDNVDTGNYWYPFDGTAPYDDIVGSSSQDRYPMLFMVDTPIINSPEDVYYPEFSTGNTILFSPHDNELRDWTVTIDGNPWVSGVWAFDVIEIPIDGLSYGVHTLEMTVWDVDQNSVSDIVIINVYDDINPIINEIPDRIVFEDGTDQELSWNVQDLHPGQYTLYRDGEVYDTGSWSTGVLSVNVDGMTEGDYLFVMEIRDLDGNADSDSVRVRVIDDNTNPTIDSPADLIIIEGTQPHYITWTPYDEYPTYYEVEWNNTVVKSGRWGGGKVILNVDNLAIGEYQFTLTVYDGSGRTASDSVNVTVMAFGDQVPPLDWLLIVIIGAGIGGTLIIIAAVLHIRKKKAS
ncbi:MAG: hypothetical protein GF411_18590 [Candidatus Lokiarchaeota archaeon]|nr:hypothetical protein [Candidatus Lokiarchaeota archaeon]